MLQNKTETETAIAMGFSIVNKYDAENDKMALDRASVQAGLIGDTTKKIRANGNVKIDFSRLSLSLQQQIPTIEVFFRDVFTEMKAGYPNDTTPIEEDN